MPSSLSKKKRTAVRGLGEIALRVNDLDKVQKFYEEIIGLPLRRHSFPMASTSG
jgi:catechol-2,3-dioxygenase